jgi:hypothetical protein
VLDRHRAPIRTTEGTRARVWSFRDLTALRTARDALRETHERLVQAALLAHDPAGEASSRARRVLILMAWQVYRVKSSQRAQLEEALGDDILSRQSLQIRDARHFGIPGDWVYLFVDGGEAGITRADAVLLGFAERAPDADKLHDMLVAEDEAAASGLGSIFG